MTASTPFTATDFRFEQPEHGTLSPSVRCGRGVRIRAGHVTIEEGVELHDGVTLAGDRIHIGAGTVVRAGSDLRSSELILGPRCDVGASSKIIAADRFVLGSAGRLDDDARITCRRFEAGNLLYVGDDFCVGAGGTTESTAEVTIGHRVALGSHCVLNANLPITLGDQVGSGDYVTLWTSGFHFGHSILDGYQPAFAPIDIERNVWLAYHVTVLPGVRIGHDTIVASGSIVTRDVPARSLAAGVPAQVRKRLEPVVPGRLELAAAIESLLDGWATQLVWKGWTVESRGTGRSVTAPDGRRGFVELIAPDARPLCPPDHELHVVVTIDARPDLLPGPTTALLELTAGAYRGASFDLAEDLRDNLRRHTLPCGEDRLFQSIVPARFAYLRSML
jgi:acetyltransferase-like isoleucine patch superfamily enzyme